MPRQQRDHRGESFEIRNTTRATTDHRVILRWAEEQRARPARRLHGTRDDPATLRLNFPDNGPNPELEPISWADWFRTFDRSNLAFLYEERTAGGRRDNFYRLVFRATVEDLVGDEGDRLAQEVDSHDVG